MPLTTLFLIFGFFDRGFYESHIFNASIEPANPRKAREIAVQPSVERQESDRTLGNAASPSDSSICEHWRVSATMDGGDVRRF